MEHIDKREEVILYNDTSDLLCYKELRVTEIHQTQAKS